MQNQIKSEEQFQAKKAELRAAAHDRLESLFDKKGKVSRCVLGRACLITSCRACSRFGLCQIKFCWNLPARTLLLLHASCSWVNSTAWQSAELTMKSAFSCTPEQQGNWQLC